MVSALNARVAENRQKLASLVKIAILCGKQNIALRGGHEHLHADTDCNRGNFLALVDFRIDAGDTLLKTHVESAARNATYTSKTIQNQLIDVIGKHIQNKLVKEIEENRLFAILADEATDSSNKEQLPLVLRYVSKERNIREVFLGFFECSDGVTGTAVSEVILCAVEELGLDMTLCRGQCYDGAGNMSGKCKGASSIIKQTYKKAQYIHCQSHRLNLCVMKSCGIQVVANMMSTLEQLNLFFENSPKRQYLLERKIKVTTFDIRYIVRCKFCT